VSTARRLPRNVPLVTDHAARNPVAPAGPPAGTAGPEHGPTPARDADHYVLHPGCLQGGCFPIPDILDVDGSAAGWPALPFANCIFQTVDAISATGRFLAWHSGGATLAPCLPEGNYLVDRTTGVASPLAISGGVIGVSRDANALLFTADGSFLPGGTAGRTDLSTWPIVPATPTRDQHLDHGQRSRRRRHGRAALRRRAPDRVRDYRRQPRSRRPQWGGRRVRAPRLGPADALT
jgi:hypothetical protein